jgi:voltage-gated potassium channel
MNEALRIIDWVRAHRWAILLVGILFLLLASPFPGVYDREDNVITPLAAVVVLAVTLCTAQRFLTVALMTLLTVTWLSISIATDGSGLFASDHIKDPVLIAPVLFLVVMGSVFFLLASWMARVTTINAETLCAAVCGYLILGLFWTGIYALVQNVHPHAIASSDAKDLQHGDLIYFSYTTLTTTGFGDLTPKSSFARMWAVIEAVAGTFYNAIVIARFVTLYGFTTAPARPE